MSFILDALKKSETDRQQKSAPGIADVPNASRKAAAPRWMPALIVLLLVNLTAVVYLAFRPADEPNAEVPAAVPLAATVTDNRASNAGTNTATAPIVEPDPTAGTNTVTAPILGSEPAAGTPPVRQTPEPAQPAAEPRSVTTATPGFDSITPDPEATVRASVNRPAPAPVEDESWLTLNDLRASGNIDLPEMHVDLHVFSETPGERFVFINMNEYRENASLPQGPTVKEITPEGVLLNYRGTTFLLPRD